METTRDEKNNDNGQDKRKNEIEMSFSRITTDTISKIKCKRTRSHSKSLCTMHDNTSPGYEWLLPGWVVEERHMKSGRIYKYYYDPEGNIYYSKGEVIAAWEKFGMIVIEE